jgi:gas vesicle protein
MNWQELSTHSHYQTVLAIQMELRKGNISEADNGIMALITVLSRTKKRALKNQLIRLMKYIIQWESQPQKRSKSWAATIHHARNEIKDIQEETPSLTDKVIRQMWDTCLIAAIVAAEDEMNQDSQIKQLSWEAVWKKDYSLAIPKI